MEKEYEDVEQEFWNPEKPEDSINGILISIEENIGKFKSKVYNIKQDNGNVISVWGSTVLDNKMALIEVGEDIKLVYLGKPDGKNYDDYKIQKAKKQ